MILEGLVTTTNPDGTPHLAPMGPHVEPDMRRFLLRPFPTSNTYRNLEAHGVGVLHVTDNVLLLAKAAVGEAEMPALRPATAVRGWVIADACRCYEFRVRSIDASEQRVRIECEVVRSEPLRDFFGFNRGKHAVLEAAILATRLHLLPREEVEAEYRKLRVIVNKTGGTQEREAMTFLEDYLSRHPIGGPSA
ncbi:MAG TPA: DUF447 domain-containing protein [Fimbriiglobus sp.]|nr:DUF447 domain-containing protein [Fimbriiglobus sp.]